MITLPSKPELRAFARGRDVDRLGYAHTLAHHFAAIAIRQHRLSLAFGWETESGRWACYESSQAWRRYDRCTRFLYENTKM